MENCAPRYVVKSQFERNLEDTDSAHTAWILGLSFVGIVMMVGLAAMPLLQIMKQSGEQGNLQGQNQPRLSAPKKPVQSKPGPTQPVAPPASKARPAIPEAPPKPQPVPPAKKGDRTPSPPEGNPPAAAANLPLSPPAPKLPKGLDYGLETTFAPDRAPLTDSFFENSLVRIYRKKHPNDAMTNRELTESMGDHFKSNDSFVIYAEKFPDWARQYYIIKKLNGQK